MPPPDELIDEVRYRWLAVAGVRAQTTAAESVVDSF